ncbi:hypothetical protein V1478_007336 [Vespula squamosa]|uniref:Uncharacterized protein n=1 Tax=Vespula squamosa TaxID=30214 RepID=A0ABD2B2Y3_VESSQ
MAAVSAGSRKAGWSDSTLCCSKGTEQVTVLVKMQVETVGWTEVRMRIRRRLVGFHGGGNGGLLPVPPPVELVVVEVVAMEVEEERFVSSSSDADIADVGGSEGGIR